MRMALFSEHIQCGDAYNHITNAKVETTEEMTVEDGSRNVEREEVPEVYENEDEGT